MAGYLGRPLAGHWLGQGLGMGRPLAGHLLPNFDSKLTFNLKLNLNFLSNQFASKAGWPLDGQWLAVGWPARGHSYNGQPKASHLERKNIENM